MAASADVLIGLLDEFRAREDVSLHETGRLLDGLGSKDSFVHSFLLLQNLICFHSSESTKLIIDLGEGEKRVLFLIS